MKAEKALKGLFKIKGMPYIIMALFAGIALLLLSGTETEPIKNEPNLPSSAEYANGLKAEAEKLILAVDGIKSCTVAISLESGYQYHYAYDQHINLSYSETGALTSKQTETAYKTVTSDGDSNLVLVKEVMPKVRGVAVVCKGASDDKAVEIKILLSALFGINSDQVYIENFK